jgi:preprotein translocase subunit SecF
MSRLGSLGHKLYTGQASYEFVGRWKRWLAISVVVMVIGLIGLLVRGLSLSLEFKGGTQFTFPNKGYSVTEVATVVAAAGAPSPVVQRLSNAGVGVANYQVETKPLSTPETAKVTDAITSHFGVTKAQVSINSVGSSWGKQITTKALESLIIFLLAIIVYLSLRYEWKMAAAAIVALIHDLIITTGIYALVGFDVSPSTVIGLLTILGYSLYDTVVVFDKVRENTAPIAGGSRFTYSQAANLAVNQTLVRSINTSIIALLPVASLLFVGAGLLGAGSLKDLALALFIGLATGSYSSIFIATPLLVLLKEREPQYTALAKRVAARTGSASRTPVAVAAAAAGAGKTTMVERTDPSATGTVEADAFGAAQSGTPDPNRPDTGPARLPASAGRRPATPPRRPGGRPSGKKRKR